MNEAVFAIGVLSTSFVLLFALIAFLAGLKEALIVMGFTLGFLVALATISVFWIWVAGGFA